MAMRKVQRKTRPWMVYWKNPVTKKQEAKTFETHKKALAFDAKIKAQIATAPESFAVASAKSPTFSAVASQYLVEAELSDSTISTTLINLKKEILPHIGGIPIADLSEDHLSAMVGTWAAKGNKQVTRNRKLSYVKSILAWAKNQRIITVIPAPDYSVPRGPDKQFVPPSPSERDAIWESAPDHIQRAIVLATCTGVRVGQSELLKIKWSDVRWRESELVIEAAKKNKNIQYRRLPITAPLLAALGVWFAADQELKPQPETIIHWKSRRIAAIKTAWKNTLTRAGITRQIRPYDLRHYFATMALAGGGDDKAVSQIMGHANTTMIRRHYQHVLDAQHVAAVQTITLPTHPDHPEKPQ